ncbi:hypothetical protein B0H10DRAFT_2070949 [Mycena sp. CBHHK59/15]|nr:hypothetical protein B0H10DRAFT_2070949 [Mycena sp. CBHHK59/15]
MMGRYRHPRLPQFSHHQNCEKFPAPTGGKANSPAKSAGREMSARARCSRGTNSQTKSGANWVKENSQAKSAGREMSARAS